MKFEIDIETLVERVNNARIRSEKFAAETPTNNGSAHFIGALSLIFGCIDKRLDTAILGREFGSKP